MPLPDLPAYYYYDHFQEMLRFVESLYGEILDDAHRGFMASFRRLPKDAQCLFIRISNRKGRIFHREALRYAEIADIDAALDILRAAGLVRAVADADYRDLLTTFNRDALLKLTAHIDEPACRTSWPKARLIAHLTAHLPYAALAILLPLDSFIVQEEKSSVDFLLYLHFGRTQENLTVFALRDLGIVRVNDAASFDARFSDAAEARACFDYSQLLDRLDRGAPADFERAATILWQAPDGLTPYADSLRARAVYKTGQYFEKQKDSATALALYQLSSAPECNERVIRLLCAQGAAGEAKVLLEQLIDDPGSDAEYDFAVDFYARKFDRQRVGACTGLLRDARTIAIDDTHRNAPEEGAAAYFRRDGWQAYRTENVFWHALFGLLFWAPLFGPTARRHSHFDRLPACLKDGTFGTLFAAPIASILSAIRGGAGLSLVLKAIAAHWEEENGLFNWQAVDIEAFRDFFAQGSPSAIATILENMVRDFHNLRDGFPDLLLVRDGELKFVEIKAEGDAIRRNQLTRLRQLQVAGFQAEICRVSYQYDPAQIYVVVDIETTGGRSGNDRITEIGAVKIRDGIVLAKFHSLINPQRRIPAYITSFTGISDAMVANAPLFADIADKFQVFMGDAIFAAHNVNFDYGFIAAEYRRLDRVFRHPKFCTCANMRRHYPGHKSYSLGALCEIYDVALPDHHRALCDAKAAAGLLALINRRRNSIVEERAIEQAA